jgi:alkaline phosphatase
MKNDKSTKLAGLLAKEHLPQMLEGRGDMLPEMTAKAIEVLSKDKDGFFLMVEASMIDWGAHDKNFEYVVAETIDLDKTVGVALNFAKSNRETLVIVTADHETGGLTLPGGNIKEKTVRSAFSTTNHTAVMVPLLAYGPGAQMYSGIHDNTFYFNNFMQQLRLKK